MGVELQEKLRCLDVERQSPNFDFLLSRSLNKAFSSLVYSPITQGTWLCAAELRKRGEFRSPQRHFTLLFKTLCKKERFFNASLIVYLKSSCYDITDKNKLR